MRSLTPEEIARAREAGRRVLVDELVARLAEISRDMPVMDRVRLQLWICNVLLWELPPQAASQ